MQIKKLFAVMMIALLTVMTMTTGQVANAAATDKKTGSLTVHKYEQELDKLGTGETGTGLPGQGVPTDAKPLAGVVYTIQQTHSYNPSTDKWTDTTGEAINITTGADGVAKFEGLKLGRYTVDETSGPDHVNLNPETLSVDIPMTSADGKTINYDVHIYPKNETKRGAVELLKQNGEKDNAPLAGAKFTLHYEENDKEVNVGTIYESTHEGLIQVEGLAYGKYYFLEVEAPKDFLKQSGKHEFSIIDSASFIGDNPGKNVIKIELANYLDPVIVKTVDKPDANRGDTVKYSLTIDLPSDIKSYKSFVITDVLDTNLTYVAGSAVVPTGFTFTDAGKTLTWKATDFTALKGGKVTITFDAKIAENAEVTTIGNKASIDYKNNSGTTGEKETPPAVVTLTDGGFKVLKVDAANKTTTLKGAEFKLTDVAGNTIDAGGTLIKVNGESYTGKLDNLVTLENGVFTIDGLDVGTYHLVETKAPTYIEGETEKSYRLLTKPIEVKVTAIDTSENKTVTVENSKSGWELPKTGGFGTTIFTIVGLLLMAGAIYIYARKEKSAVQ